MTGISGKVVAVTGASSGIGEAAARLLAEQGAAVVLGARRTERLDQIAQQIRDRCQIPVIYLTAYADDDTLCRATLTGRSMFSAWMLATSPSTSPISRSRLTSSPVLTRNRR